jgi:Flp pilus assembly protein TadG
MTCMQKKARTESREDRQQRQILLAGPVRRRSRRGAVLSTELILLVPIAFGLLMALAEFSMLWLANQRVVAAAQAACRTATLPGATVDAVQQAAASALAKPALISQATIEVTWAQHSGDPVLVEVRLPMRAAAPDLLAFLGFGLGDGQLVAQCVMRKE